MNNSVIPNGNNNPIKMDKNERIIPTLISVKAHSQKKLTLRDLSLPSFGADSRAAVHTSLQFLLYSL